MTSFLYYTIQSRFFEYIGEIQPVCISIPLSLLLVYWINWTYKEETAMVQGWNPAVPPFVVCEHPSKKFKFKTFIEQSWTFSNSSVIILSRLLRNFLFWALFEHLWGYWSGYYYTCWSGSTEYFLTESGFSVVSQIPRQMRKIFL